MNMQGQFKNRGGTSILAVFFVSLFTVLAISFTGMTDINVQMAKNHRDLSEAQAAAESGLAYAHSLFSGYMTVATGTFNPSLTNVEAQAIFDEFVVYTQNNLDGSVIIDEGYVPESTDFTEGGVTGSQLVMPVMKVDSDDLSGYVLTFKQYDDAPHTLEITSEGQVGDVSRRVRLNYTILKDTSLLEYSVFSKSRIIVTGDSTIDGDIYTIWDDPTIAAPVELATESTINGTVDTTVSEADWDGAEIEGTNEGIHYDNPNIDDFNPEDFDTSSYFDQTTKIKTSGNIGQIAEYFPHAAGNYALPADGSSNQIHRKVFENQHYTDRYMAAGNDTLFRNCTFDGILFVGSGPDSGGNQTNNIRFENCIFNGTIASNVPNNFSEESWKKNVLYFTGSNIFNNSHSDTATILAPNYNVNIGNTQEAQEGVTNVIEGLVVGGVVDLRGNVHVDGTILSMAYPDPDDWGLEAGEVATNIGFSDENDESGVPGEVGTILVSPSTDRQFPMGIRTDTLVLRDGNSYVEL